jgi:hypothetical protein
VPAIAIFAVPAQVQNRDLRWQLMQPTGGRARHGLLLKRLPWKALNSSDRQHRVGLEPVPPAALDRIGAVTIVHADQS